MSSQKVPNGYRQTEVGVIPDDWRITEVTGIASPVKNAIVGGPFGSDLVSNDYVEDGIPVIRGQNMGGRYISGNFVFVTQEKARSLESNLAQSQDLLFTQRGTLGQVSLVPSNSFDRYLVSQSQMKLTVNRKIADPLFFYYIFSSSEQQKYVQLNTIQTGVPHVNLGILRCTPIQVPPIAEQKQIARALSDIDALIEALEGAIGKKCQIKQGAMQELLTGKQRLPGFDNQWEVKRFGELVAPRSERVDPRKSGVHNFCIELEHIGSGTGLLVGSTTTGSQSSLKSVFYQGDVLFGKLRAYLRKYWQANRCGVCSTEIWVLSPKDKLILTTYLFQVIQTDQFIEIATLSYGTHMPRSDWSIVKNYELFLPPTIEEQQAIATILSDMDTDIAAIEEKLTKTRQLKQGMMHELLTGRIRLV